MKSIFRCFTRRRLRNKRRTHRTPLQTTETFESRLLLTVYNITTVEDVVADDGVISLREAVQAASINAPVNEAAAGGAVDVIEFDFGLRGQPIQLNSRLDVIGDLTIQGKMVLDGQSSTSILYVLPQGNLTLARTTLANGLSPGDGGAILNRGQLTLDEVHFDDNVAEGHGGAIANFGTLTIESSTFQNNAALEQGGAIYSEGTIQVSDSTASNNTATNNGGAISAIEGTLRIESSHFYQNSGASGGAVFSQAVADISSSSFVENTAVRSGGAIAMAGQNSLLSNSTIAFNQAGELGGGVMIPFDQVFVLASTIVRNVAGTNSNAVNTGGGGIAAIGGLILGSTLVTGNRSGVLQDRAPDDLIAMDQPITGSWSFIGDPGSAVGLVHGENGMIIGNGLGGFRGVEGIVSLEPDPDSDTYVLPLPQSSPAVETGNNDHAIGANFGPLLFDGRSNPFPRISQSSSVGSLRMDIGAFEFLPKEPLILSIDTDEHSSSANVDWQRGHLADHYELNVENLTSGQVGDQPFLEQNDLPADIVFYKLTSLPEGRYRLRIRAIDCNDEISEWQEQHFEIQTRPEITSAAFSAATNRFEVSWIAQPDTVRTEFWVTNHSSGTDPLVFEVDAVAGQNTHSFEQADPGRYSIWIRTTNSQGETSLWSQPAILRLGPQLISPTTGTFQLRPTFEWQPVAGATSYQVWVSDGENVVINAADVLDNSFTPDFDLEANTFFWWVRAELSSEYSPWSEPKTFNTLGRATVVEQQQDPWDSPLVTIRWRPVEGAESYRLYVRHLDTQQIILNDVVGNVADQLVPLQKTGRYEVWVQASGSDGPGVWSSRAVYESNNQPEGVPQANLQETANQFGTSVSIRWQGENGAEVYHYVAWNRETGQEIKGRIGGSGHVVLNRLDQGKWNWFVRPSTQALEAGEWYEGNSFFIGGRTTLTGPAPITNDRTPLLTWNPVSDASRYELVLQDHVGTEILRIADLAAAAVSYQLNDELNPGNYRAWIRAYDSNNLPGPWTVQHRFQVQ